MRNAVPEELINEFIDKVLGGELRCIIKDSGGAGLCGEVSKEFLTFVGDGALLWFMANDLEVAGYRGTWGFSGHHCTTLIGDTVYDFTARQFHKEMPFPYVFDFNHTGMVKCPLREDAGLCVYEAVLPSRLHEWESWKHELDGRRSAV